MDTQLDPSGYLVAPEYEGLSHAHATGWGHTNCEQSFDHAVVGISAIQK